MVVARTTLGMSPWSAWNTSHSLAAILKPFSRMHRAMYDGSPQGGNARLPRLSGMQ